MNSEWLHMLAQRSDWFDPTHPTHDPQAAWTVCEALLESGVDPTELDASGVSASMLFNEHLRAGAIAPQNQKVLHRLLSEDLERRTAQVSTNHRVMRM